MEIPSKTRSELIKVKIVSPFSERWFLHQIPEDMCWGNCKFTLNRNEEAYDWLVVYNNVPNLPKNLGKFGYENLSCHPKHTLLSTTEPSSITHYSKAFTNQFGCVLTSQANWALPHKDRIHQQAGLIWLYGIGYEGPAQSFNFMVNNPPSLKKNDLAMVFSEKKMRCTLHRKRYNFMLRMEQYFPQMHIYGRSSNHISLDDKTDALATYRYSFAIENHIEDHHWTEKLSDAFLGLTLPFYAGCSNAADYFPKESFVSIDLKNPQRAAEIIKNTIKNHEYEKRLPFIHEARRRVLFEHNLFAVLNREIGKRYKPELIQNKKSRIYSRHSIRKQHPLNAFRDFTGKIKAKIKHFEM
jgi:hypothetical protein